MRRLWLVVLGLGVVLLVAYSLRRPLDEADSPPPPGTESRTDRESVGLSEEERPSPPTSSDQSASQREPGPPAPAEFLGRVVDSLGKPVPDGLVQVIPWTRGDLDWEPAWQADDWGPLDRRRATQRTNAAGEFSFDPQPGAELGSVLWASHQEFLAGCLLVPPAHEGLIEIVLESAPGSRVAVVDASGRRVPSAVVRQFGLTPASASRGADGRTIERARRLLTGEYRTKETGLADVDRFPGDVVLVASASGRSSLPWRGTPGASLTLELGNTFSVGGQVSLPDWSHLNYEGERRILVEAEWLGERRALASVREVVAGPWGPLLIPLVPQARYTVRLEGSPIIPAFHEFAAPAPDQHLNIVLAAEMGHALSVRALDEHGAGVPDAEATSSWFEGDRERVLRRRADPEGYIDNWSFPSGAHVRTLVSAPGRASQWTDEVLFPEDRPQTHPVILRHGSRLVGRCMQGGAPARDFDIIVWEPLHARFTQVRRTFRDRDDGSFEFPDAPMGAIAVSAATSELSYSRPIHATLPSEEQVVLELVSPLRGRGRVVDLETDEPVDSASVQTFTVLSDGSLRPWGRPRSVDSGGEFAFDGFVMGQNVVRVSAEGFALREARAFAREGTVDFGRITLDRPRHLTLQLVAEEPFDFTRVSATGADDHPLPRKSFDAGGFVRFEGINDGARLVKLEGSPQAPWIFLRLDLEPRKEWSYTHRVSGRRRLNVEVVGSSDDVPSIVGLSISYQAPRGVLTEMGIPFRLDGSTSIVGIDADSAQVEVMGPVKVQASVLAELRGDELHARLDLGEEPFRLRVVDSGGAPIPGTLVRLTDSLPTAFYLVATTDETGAFLFTGVPRRAVLVSLEHESRGRLFGARIDGAAGAAEVVLSSEASLHLGALDGDVPIVGVLARAQVSSLGPRWSVLGYSDDAGRVLAEQMGAGVYTVSLNHAECWPVTVECRASIPPELQRVQIRRLGSLGFTLSTPEGAVVRGLRLELHSIEFDTDVANWIQEKRVSSRSGLVSDAQGEIRVHGLPRGSYRYRVATSQGETVEGLCEVPPGALASVPIIVR